MEPQIKPETVRVAAPQVGRWLRLDDVLPMAVAVYLIGLAVYLSSRRMMWLDEFFAWGVLTDPSLSHAMHAWLEGADSGGALYYILGHTLLAITGPSVLAARLFGAVLLAGAYLLWFRLLRQVFDQRVALIASGVLLTSSGYINYLAEVRFYSQLIAAIVLAVWLTFWVQRETRSPGFTFAVFFLVHGALVSSHLLGIVYSAMVLVGMLVCRGAKRYLVAAAAIVMSWSLLLFARRPIHVGGLRVASFHLSPPHWRELFEFFHSQPTVFYKANLLLYLLFAVGAFQWLRHRQGKWPFQDEASSLLFRVSLLLGAAPVVFFAESRIAPWSLWVLRYMLPCVLGISGLTGFVLEFQSGRPWMKRCSRLTKNSIFAAAVAVVVLLHVDDVRHQVRRPRFTENELRPIEQGLPLMVASEGLFFQLKFYEAAALPPVTFVFPLSPYDTMAGDDLMRTIRRQGYWYGSFQDRSEFIQENSGFVLLESNERNTDLLQQLRQRGWIVEAQGRDELGGGSVSVFRVTRPKA